MGLSLGLPLVRERQSSLAPPTAKALWIPAEAAHGPGEAFIVDCEFCHVHSLPEGSLHLTLPWPERREAIELGWAEQHPVAQAGFLPDTLVTVYAPRDDPECQMVFSLVEASYRFATGVAR